MQTLLLDVSAWDLVVDTKGDIAVASDPYSLAQDSASMIKLFAGELYYDTTLGVPYFNGILGSLPPITLIKQQLIAQVLQRLNSAGTVVRGVPEVVTAAVFLTALTNRELHGQVQVSSSTGGAPIAVANF